MAAHIQTPKKALAEFCKRNHIRKLSFFGSVLRDDFRPDSDVDVLVEFHPGIPVGYLRLTQIEDELSIMLGGRRIDFVNHKYLNLRIKDRVLESAKVQYAEG